MIIAYIVIKSYIAEVAAPGFDVKVIVYAH
jgi:hypothetical protein